MQPAPPTAPSATARPRGVAAVRRGTRLEIQALRALAVAAVVVYHLRPAALPGGFVGVDVFFVISGFLISRHLVREAESTGRIDLAAFWAGRVRRILPAALVTTVVVVAAAALLLPGPAAAEVARTGWWAALSGANWLFAAHSVDYLAQAADASPFEHFWSLGVEEQFYLVWPLLALAAAVVVRRRRVTLRRAIAVPFAVVLVASFAFGAWFTATGSPAAYFITPTRMWELAAGGLLAVLLGDRAPGPRAAVALQLGGLVVIGAGLVLLDGTTPMPGTAALLPVAGAAAFLAAGDAPGLRRVWALRPVQVVGDTSYSLYLWHWPIIVFVREATGHPIGLRTGVAVLLASTVATALSYLLVEQPLRRVRIHPPLRVVAAGGAAIALVVGIAAVPVAADAAAESRVAAVRQALLASSAAAPLGYPELTPAADRTWARAEHVVVPAPSVLAADLSLRDCTVVPTSTTSPICEIGDRSATTTIAIVGDSHMRQWGSVLDVVAKRHHWRVLTVLHNSCPFSLRPRSMEEEGRSRCTDAVRWALPELSKRGVQVVVTSAYRESYPKQDTEAAADDYAAMLQTLQDAGMGVVVLGDTPTPSARPLTIDCIAEGDPARCGVTRAHAESYPDPLLLAARRTPGTAELDPVSAFCGRTWCPGVIGNVGVWVDDNHASRTYLMTATPWVDQHLVPLVEQQLARATA